MLKRATNYHSNIYTLPIFKTIQNMLKDIVDNEVCNIPKDGIELDGELFHFILIDGGDYDYIKGLKRSQNNDEWNDTVTEKILSYKQLINQDLALITTKGILIYTIVENFVRLRYIWNNEKWGDYFRKNHLKNIADIIDDYKIIIQEVLKTEFNDSRSSLPSPNFS